MVRKIDLGGHDRSHISLSLVFLVLLGSTLFYVLNIQYNSPSLQDIHGNGGMESWLKSTFRLCSAYLAFHTVLFWMVFNPEPATMVVLFRKELEVREHDAIGIEKIGTFSSWTLIVFGSSMLLNGTLSLSVALGYEIPNSLLLIGVSLFAAGFGAACITSVVVRHLIIPMKIRNGHELHHLFKPHEQVMHNLVLILFSLDLLYGGTWISWPSLSLTLILGSLYVAFAELSSRRDHGYYVYEFLDPRPKLSPFIFFGLMIACIASLFFGYLITTLKDERSLIASSLLLLFVILSVRFNASVNEN